MNESIEDIAVGAEAGVTLLLIRLEVLHIFEFVQQRLCGCGVVEKVKCKNSFGGVVGVCTDKWS